MEQYGKILLIAMPAFLVLVLFEKAYGWFRGQDTVPHSDMISSLSSGVTNVTKDVLGLSVIVLSYGWLVGKIALVHLPDNWIVYAVAFICLDFAGYWVHRIAHEYNLFWNNHIIHHSSEEFNLACALRQSISVFFSVFGFFLIPAALLGVPATVIAVVAPLHLFAQFWYHTRHIGKMGFLEYILVTPSHHRVHHAINPEYLDKNYSQIFIFWDKLFGTYQAELPTVTPIYGVTRPVKTWNPIKINFLHVWLLIKDAWHASQWKDKLRIWFMPLGWRPDDVAQQFPVYKIENVYAYQKYNPHVSRSVLIWSWVQLLALLLFVSYLFGNLKQIGSPGMFWYGAFVFLSVYAFTELMDKNRFAYFWELARFVLALFLWWKFNGWFGIDAWLPGMSVVILIYLAIAAVLSVVFSRQQSTVSK